MKIRGHGGVSPEMGPLEENKSYRRLSEAKGGGTFLVWRYGFNILGWP